MLKDLYKTNLFIDFTSHKILQVCLASFSIGVKTGFFIILSHCHIVTFQLSEYMELMVVVETIEKDTIIHSQLVIHTSFGNLIFLN